jgi:hypothetical protein
VRAGAVGTRSAFPHPGSAGCAAARRCGAALRRAHCGLRRWARTLILLPDTNRGCSMGNDGCDAAASILPCCSTLQDRVRRLRLFAKERFEVNLMVKKEKRANVWVCKQRWRCRGQGWIRLRCVQCIFVSDDFTRPVRKGLSFGVSRSPFYS